ncbi:hypothetical protein O0L34_g4317 [Tuta absoluta]|nr:hypothetical protein O0L34_g4317 [Tuta absoluta]
MSKAFKKNMVDHVLNDPKDIALNEEWNNFVKRIGEVTNLVRDLSSGDKEKAEAAKVMADKYLDGKVILDENVQMTVKSDRTVINQKAFKNMGKQNAGEMDKDSWMDAVSKDAEQRAADRKVRKERADTFKTMAMKAFNRGEYEKALSCYNKAIEQVKDNAMLYCDRALTNIKLGNYEKVFDDVHWAQRINENSFKARLYRAKAHKELEQQDKLEECRKELDEMFPQHKELIQFFLDKQVKETEEEEEVKDTILI